MAVSVQRLAGPYRLFFSLGVCCFPQTFGTVTGGARSDSMVAGVTEVVSVTLMSDGFILHPVRGWLGACDRQTRLCLFLHVAAVSSPIHCEKCKILLFEPSWGRQAVLLGKQESRKLLRGGECCYSGLSQAAGEGSSAAHAACVPPKTCPSALCFFKGLGDLLSWHLAVL